MTIANLCGVFALICIGAFAWMVGAGLIFHAPEIFAWMRDHIAATIFWASAIGFGVCFMTGIRT